MTSCKAAVLPLLLLLLPLAMPACHRDAPPREATVAVDSLEVYRRVPPDSMIRHDQLGASIRRGLALVTDTRDSLPANVGNRLQCVSCHPAGGRQPGAMPWIGVYGRFPSIAAAGAG